MTLRALKPANKLNIKISWVKRLFVILRGNSRKLNYSLHDKPRSGRPTLSEDRAEAVLESTRRLQETNTLGRCSSTQVAEVTGLPSRSARRILRQTLGLYPYHFTMNQGIFETDKQRRLDLARWVLNNKKYPRSSFVDRWSLLHAADGISKMQALNTIMNSSLKLHYWSVLLFSWAFVPYFSNSNSNCSCT